MVSHSNSPGDDIASQAEKLPVISSLRELIDHVSGRGFLPATGEAESGIAEVVPFPFLALVNQKEMKLALLLGLVNPAISGVLLIGPRGTGKTTAVRSLVELLPHMERSICYYGCLPEDIESGGIDTVCPDCARKYAMGESLVKLDRVRLVELPLNARLEDVIGGIDERVAIHERLRLRRGILVNADQNLLYIDEVNLLADDVVDAILDAAAQGNYTVRRGVVSATYRSRFVLIGSMNPEEGQLRPQILDRFGLRVIVNSLQDLSDRLEAYRRAQAYKRNPRQTVAQYASDSALVCQDIQEARELLPRVELGDAVAKKGLELIHHLGIDSLRAEITLFEAARAHAAINGRMEVTSQDICQVGLMALRMRRSRFMNEYLARQGIEDEEIQEELAKVK